MNYWRITSFNKANLVAGWDAGQWGSPKKSLLSSFEKGDKLLFYCSTAARALDRGYWGLGVVTRSAFHSEARIWLDDTYPFRIGFRPLLFLKESISGASVRAELGPGRFKYQRMSGVFRLDPREYEIAEGLMRQAEQRQNGRSP